jgi:anti-anti-sigma factor
MDFAVVVDKQAAIPTVRISGEFDLYAAPEFCNCARNAIGDGQSMVVCVDLEHCTYIDSEGIKALLRMKLRLGDGGRVIISRASPVAQRVIHLVGLDSPDGPLG